MSVIAILGLSTPFCTLEGLATAPEGTYVPIYDGTKRIWTLSLNTRASGTPLVLLHGMGSGVALWVVNLDSLSRSRPVYAIDLLGFGRSTRTTFSKDPLMVGDVEFICQCFVSKSILNNFQSCNYSRNTAVYIIISLKNYLNIKIDFLTAFVAVQFYHVCKIMGLNISVR